MATMTLPAGDDRIHHHPTHTRIIPPLRHDSFSSEQINIPVAHVVSPSAMEELREENERLTSRLRQIVEAEEIVAQSVVIDGDDPEAHLHGNDHSRNIHNSNSRSWVCSFLRTSVESAEDPVDGTSMHDPEQEYLERRFQKNQRRLWILLCTSTMALILLLSVWVPIDKRRRRIEQMMKKTEDNPNPSDEPTQSPSSSVTFTLKQDGEDIRGDKFLQYGLVNDIFGYPVAISKNGDKLVVGAIGGDGANQSDCGVARIFEQRQGEGTWIETGSDHEWVPGEERWQWHQTGTDWEGYSIGDMFGANVAISDEGNVVGVASLAGYVEIINITNEDHDEFLETTIQSVSPLMSISSDGSKLVVLAQNESHTSPSTLHLYENTYLGWNASGSCQVDAPSSLDMSSFGTRVVIGAALANTTTKQVTVLDCTGSEWIEVGSGINGEDDELLGFNTRISSDGTRIIVAGRKRNNDDDWTDFVRTYDWSHLEDEWIQVGFDVLATYSGGIALSMDGSIMVLGDRMGGFRVFEARSASKWTEIYFASDLEITDDLVSSVAISYAPSDTEQGKMRIVVGSPSGNYVRTFSLSCSGSSCPSPYSLSVPSLLDPIHHETIAQPSGSATTLSPTDSIADLEDKTTVSPDSQTFTPTLSVTEMILQQETRDDDTP